MYIYIYIYIKQYILNDVVSKFVRNFDQTSTPQCRSLVEISTKLRHPKCRSLVEVWEGHASEMMQICYGRLVIRAITGDGLLTMTPQQKWEAGLVDPKQFSTKDEMHYITKMLQGCWRQIWMVSTIDLMVTAITAKAINDKDKERFQVGDAHDWAICLGHRDNGIQRLGEAIQHQFLTGVVVSEDASGWDMSVSPEAKILSASSRASTWLLNGCPGLAYLTMCDGYCHMGHMAQAGDKLMESCVYGQMESGSLEGTHISDRCFHPQCIELCGRRLLPRITGCEHSTLCTRELTRQ